MTAAPKNAKLTWQERLLNLAVLCHSLLVSPWMMLRFILRINQHRGPRVGRGPRWPRTIQSNTLATGAPGGLITQWEQYGIPSVMLPGGFVRVIGKRKERICSFWVSPDQHWIADRQARALGWAIYSPAVQCHRRGSSAVDAEKGAWRASGREPAARSLNTWLIRGVGDLLGARQPYVRHARNQPGLRRRPPVK